MLPDTVMVDTRHRSKPKECTPPKSEPCYKLQAWGRMCHGGFMDWNQCPSVVGDVDGGGDQVCRDGGIWQISAPSDQFCWDPKTAIKNKAYFIRRYTCCN